MRLEKLYLTVAILLLLCVAVPSVSAENPPVIQWQKSLGGSGDDQVRSIQQTRDNGYILVGSSDSVDGDVTGNHGGQDYWVVKLDPSGNIVWQKSLGGSGNDAGASINETHDGGYIVAGYSTSNDYDVTGNHGMNDFWVVKLRNTGSPPDIEWQKSLGGSHEDGAESILETGDGGFIVAGNTYSHDGDVTGNHGELDYWVVKLDPSGNIVWQKTLGGSNYEYVRSIRQTFDEGYIIAGHTSSNDGDITVNHGGSDWWVVKLRNTGNPPDIEWQKSLGGLGDEAAESINQTTDGGFIIVGASHSNDGEFSGNHGYIDYRIVKLNAIGDIEWQTPLGGAGSDRSISVGYTHTSAYENDIDYFIVGSADSDDGDVTGNHGMEDYWIVRLRSPGNIVWQKSLGGSLQDIAEARGAQQTRDKGYIVAGESLSNDGDVTGHHGTGAIFDIWVVKLMDVPPVTTGETPPTTQGISLSLLPVIAAITTISIATLHRKKK